MNLNPFILSSLKKLSETQTKPIQEIVLSHVGNAPTFAKCKVVENCIKPKEPLDTDQVADQVRKQLVAAKLCILSKTCQSSLANRGKDVRALHIRFEEGKKPTWTVECTPIVAKIH